MHIRVTHAQPLELARYDARAPNPNKSSYFNTRSPSADLITVAIFMFGAVYVGSVCTVFDVDQPGKHGGGGII